jgi:hypothetical protein
MALLGALCVSLNALGFTNRSLRAQVSRLLGMAYTGNQMSYDLGRLRLNGPIERLDGTNTYRLTAQGQRVAIFYTKIWAAPTATGRQRATRTHRTPHRPTHHRPPCPQLHQHRTPRKRRIRTQDQPQRLEHQGALAKFITSKWV